MNVSALSSKVVAIALVTISFSGTAGAGPLLCEEVTSHASVQSSCPDSDGHYVKVKQQIDYLFDLGMSRAPSVLSKDWSSNEVKFEPGEKADERQLRLWHPLWFSNGLSFGHGFDDGGKWTHAQLHGGQPKSVPEPGSLLLLGIGLVGAALSRRLR